MKDNYDVLLDKLFLAERLNKLDTSVIESHFETRLLARIQEQRGNRTSWLDWTWRLIPWFATIVIIVGIGSAVYDPMRSSDLFSPITNGYEEYQTVSLLVGG
ncbi:MAG: hypothetical protein HXX11_22555 [Desulfuromonadales bacterium]|nr:hypothetical protein [Desulfuromonadales bacterium]